MRQEDFVKSDRLSNLFLAFLIKVSIGICRRLNISVTEPLLEVLKLETLRCQHTRAAVPQIMETDFKKRKYEALVKRDECSDGIITVAEFTELLENCFPNRNPKQ